ncbi:MAG: hypothetical protein QM796_01450 [Chthoniobacteraceae bacterium]
MKTFASLAAVATLSLATATHSYAGDTPVIVLLNGVVKQQPSASSLTSTHDLDRETLLKLFGADTTVAPSQTKFVYYNSAIYLTSLDGTTTYGTVLNFDTPNKVGGPIHYVYQDAVTMINETLTGTSVGHVNVFNGGVDRFGDGDFNASVDDSGAITIIRGHFITGPATPFTPAP